MSLPHSDSRYRQAGIQAFTAASPAPVIVIGMHRSGTSLVARLLAELGVFMGAEVDKHHEAHCFKQVNGDLLQSEGADWARPEPFVQHLSDGASLQGYVRLARESLDRWAPLYGEIPDDQAWGWKDPRNTLTLPVWLELFPGARVVHVVRNGLDVALSLHRREPRRLLRLLRGKPIRNRMMFPPTIARGYELWATYVRLALDLETRGGPWLTVRYEEILANPCPALAPLVQFLGLEIGEEVLQRLGERVVREPAEPSPLESWRLGVLLRSGVLDPEPMRLLGYDPGV